MTLELSQIFEAPKPQSLVSARVRQFVLQRLDEKVDRVVYYTDSAVAFLWFIAEQPTKFETFVCNRILEIQKLS